ncbi:MAG: hypothetical protein ABH825_02195, partial [Candidatus Omnitrophota bacterium]
LKLKNQYFQNDSNDQYLDYYDYSAYRVDATVVMPLVFKQLYGLVNLGYQYRDYDDRTTVDDSTKTQKDDLYSIVAAVIYDLNDAFSVSLNYTYNQNESNESYEEYSGSTLSLGAHYAF